MWINSKFQSRFLMSMLLLEAQVACITTGLLSLAWTYIIKLEDPQAGIATLGTIVFFLSISIAFVVTSGFIAISISHRICGPVYNIMRALDAVKRGEKVGPIHLRKGDDFCELADAVNETFAKLGILEGSLTASQSGTAEQELDLKPSSTPSQ